MALTKEQNEYILELYEISSNSNKKARELFNKKYNLIISEITIRNKWRNADFKLNSHGGHRHGFSKQTFTKLYNKFNGDLGLMEKETNYKISSLVDLCQKHNLEPRNIPPEKHVLSSSSLYYDFFETPNSKWDIN